MHSLLKGSYAKPLALYLAVALVAISTVAGPAEAMYLFVAPHTAVDSGQRTVDRAEDIGRVQTLLESKVVQQRLMDYGLSADEAAAKLNGFSDEQLHQLAANLDSLQAGGDAASLIIVALLVVLIIYIIEGRIEIRRR